MAYEITSLVDSTNDPDVVLGVDLSFSSEGVFKPLFSTSEQATSNLKNLLLTRIGERFGQVTYGTNLLNMVFQPNVNELKIEIEEEITRAINFWLPYISINRLEIITAEEDPTLDHNTQITLEYGVLQFDTKTIIIFANETGQLIIE